MNKAHYVTVAIQVDDIVQKNLFNVLNGVSELWLDTVN